ncbi:MAG: Eco57I restriction-modification methylase domain-containing protein, partial [Pseudomonadota bacterium]
MQLAPGTTRQLRAEALLDRIAAVVRGHLPPGVTPEYLDAFLGRHRPALVAVLDRHLAARDRRVLVAEASDAPPELWTPAKRTAANLRAMELAASKRPQDMDAADRRVLAAYSGWGGLSIDKVADRFPAGFPVPEARGLIHEYYTPSKVCAEVARLLRPLVPALARRDGEVLTLEPSAGIGRFVRALSGAGFDKLRWLTVEWSELSGRMLQAVRPDLAVYLGPFERWVREHGDEYQGRIKLVVANPPYGARGGAVADDPVRAYREKQAYAYFLRRALDLLAPGGVGVFLIPAGFLTGRAARNRALREKVLKRHHLASAYRLPSVGPDGREAIFPGAMLVTDLLFFRARGGTLEAVDAGDEFILEGGYFERFPRHVLGTELGKDAGDDDQTAKPRFGYQVQGRFEGLPDLVERPLCTACKLTRDAAPEPEAPATRGRGRGRVGVARHLVSRPIGFNQVCPTNRYRLRPRPFPTSRDCLTPGVCVKDMLQAVPSASLTQPPGVQGRLGGSERGALDWERQVGNPGKRSWYGT